MPSTGTAELTLPSEKEILFTREFDAPKGLVYRAYTTPELIKRGWGGSHGKVTGAEVDPRVGGSWRYVGEFGGGRYGFHGCFHTVREDRVVWTFTFEGIPDGAMNVDTVLNICPIKPSGVQLAMAMVPPGVHTRRSSLATRSGRGANIAPIEDITTS